MNLSGNPEHREAYVLSVEPAGPVPGTVSPAGARGKRAVVDLDRRRRPHSCPKRPLEPQRGANVLRSRATSSDPSGAFLQVRGSRSSPSASPV